MKEIQKVNTKSIDHTAALLAMILNYQKQTDPQNEFRLTRLQQHH